MKKEVKEAMNAWYSNTSDEVNCLKELYKIVKDLKIFRRAETLKKIVEQGFDAACQGYLKVAFFQKVRFVFQISKSQKTNIPKNYPELEI